MKGKEMQEMKVRLGRNLNPSFRKQSCSICESLNFSAIMQEHNQNAQKNFKQINSYNSIRLNENENSKRSEKL